MSSAALFELMGEGIKAQGPELVKKVNGIIQFNVKPDMAYTIDLKTGSGEVYKGAAKTKADLVVTIADADFVKLAQNKLNPQQAFMQGKVKIKGNMGLAMKLQSVMATARSANPDLEKKAAALASGAGAAGAAAGAAGGGSSLKCGPIFDQIEAGIKERGAELVKKVNGIVRFNVDGENFTIDLKTPGGAFRRNADGKADLTITITDDNFVALQTGKLNPQQAFMSGKIKIKGNMGLAMKLQTVLKAADPRSKM